MKQLVIILCAALALSVAVPWLSSAGRPGIGGDSLFLSETPPAGHGEGHGRRGGGEHAHSEHSAVAGRIWYLNRHDLSPDAKAYILRSDGTLAEGTLNHGPKGWELPVDTKPMDGSLDGVFNIYVVDRQVSDGVLVVRVAKMNMINHSCGWGHKFKFDQERRNPKSLASIPLEIVCSGLWDGNFHSRTMSGDRLSCTILENGKTASGASVAFSTGSGWTKTVAADDAGNVSVQLIRDYYPEKWSDFDSRKRGSILVTAVYEKEEKGVFNNSSYSKVRMISTLPWRYVPARKEYTSYAYGLIIAALFTVASGAGVYVYRERRRKPYQEVDLDEKD